MEEDKVGGGIVEPLIKKDDPELKQDEDAKEQEEREDRSYCLLCAKYVDRDKMVDVQMGPVLLLVCKKCNIVLHNLNVILNRAREKQRKELKEEMEKLGKATQSVILQIPKGLFVPRKN